MSHFKIDDSQLKKFQKLIGKEFPRGFQKVTAEYLNTMAFEQRKENKKNLEQQLTIRDQRFLNNSLRVEKTKPVSINQQIAISGSIHYQKGTGWEEQQTGKPAIRKRTVTPDARGNKASKLPNKYRMKPTNKIYKPEQYEGSTYNKKFYFMMRVLGSRGGGQFYIDETIKTKRGQLHAGLYSMTKAAWKHKGKGKWGKVSNVKAKLTMLQKKSDGYVKTTRNKWTNEEWGGIKKKAEENSLLLLERWKQIQASRMNLK
jgi:hypothetical protein